MILLAPDLIRVLAPQVEDDGHGWAATLGEVEVWSGQGSCQETVPAWDGSATDRGGEGPFDPMTRAMCDLYLPEDATVIPGYIAVAHDTRWLVQRVRRAVDPVGGSVGCLVVSCVESVIPEPTGDAYS